MEINFENQKEIDEKFKEILEANELKDLLRNAELDEIAVSAIVETYEEAKKKEEVLPALLNDWLTENLKKYNVSEEEIDNILNEIKKREKKTYINPDFKKYSAGPERKIDFIKNKEKEKKEGGENKNKGEENKE